MKANSVIGWARPANSPISTCARRKRPSSRMPNTARRITSSVIRSVRERSANASFTGHVSMSRSAMRRIVSRQRLTLLP